jgi:hypothetical protein
MSSAHADLVSSQYIAHFRCLELRRGFCAVTQPITPLCERDSTAWSIAASRSGEPRTGCEFPNRGMNGCGSRSRPTLDRASSCPTNNPSDFPGKCVSSCCGRRSQRHCSATLWIMEPHTPTATGIPRAIVSKHTPARRSRFNCREPRMPCDCRGQCPGDEWTAHTIVSFWTCDSARTESQRSNSTNGHLTFSC